MILVDVLRLAVIVLAVALVGSALSIAARYLLASWRLGRSPGRILARHVAEVALGVSGLAGGFAIALYDQLSGTAILSPTERLVIYLLSMILLIVGVVEVARYQQVRARNYPARQEQVRSAIRAGLQGQRVTGPIGADRAAVFAANAVLALEGTPRLPKPPPPTRATSPADTTPTVPAEDYGRHAVRTDRRPS